jgi:hypothetical protein
MGGCSARAYYLVLRPAQGPAVTLKPVAVSAGPEGNDIVYH